MHVCYVACMAHAWACDAHAWAYSTILMNGALVCTLHACVCMLYSHMQYLLPLGEFNMFAMPFAWPWVCLPMLSSRCIRVGPMAWWVDNGDMQLNPEFQVQISPGTNPKLPHTFVVHPLTFFIILTVFMVASARHMCIIYTWHMIPILNGIAPECRKTIPNE